MIAVFEKDCIHSDCEKVRESVTVVLFHVEEAFGILFTEGILFFLEGVTPSVPGILAEDQTL